MLFSGIQFNIHGIIFINYIIQVLYILIFVKFATD